MADWRRAPPADQWPCARCANAPRGRCSRRSWLTFAPLAVRERGRVDTFGPIVTEKAAHRGSNRRFDARVDAGVVRRHAAAAARHEGIFAQLPLLLAHRRREAIAQDGGV